MRINTLKKLNCITSLLVLVTVAGCHQVPSTRKQATVPPSEQLEQTASIAAATRYLKRKCNRSDLPDDQAILNGVNRIANGKGWQSLTQEDIRKHSDEINERLARDSTPEHIKCSEFNRLLVPFIGELLAGTSR
ncbi:GspS family T2SS pilot lipoprotein variant EptO [Escherichia coli]|jgi:general secretion pathway protein S|uniref:GspS family T2SS pilot lipoprotein variant EptO n=1 Tax=Enterobacteriaceae TaxID=543 RepID=UPI000263745F|nr:MULTISPECIES: GspS family T2SS pilot lipoprotein variant EptO [Enterobacteriaceae]EEV2770317.1 GspS family T2SS pilot lipoprotein variant EptO [Escherichia coli O145]EJH5039101.1 GspS family T2SS pilot lipoprotein variant EptO [Escherichia coli O145:H28]EKM0781425.1 GspS family T2SS pilot lipoprotein variant EptO [Shigella sonnei]HDQ6566271.1 GspS family T2SS pilot lipoprotein variant EptO [Escherichia coli O156:H25]AUJ93930.1 lipoprotein, PulS/OutS family [Escherichia coli]